MIDINEINTIKTKKLQIDLAEEIEKSARNFLDIILKSPSCREIQESQIKIEEAVMWAIKGVFGDYSSYILEKNQNNSDLYNKL